MSLEHDTHEQDETPTCSGLPADDLDDGHNEWIDEREAADDAAFVAMMERGTAGRIARGNVAAVEAICDLMRA